MSMQLLEQLKRASRLPTPPGAALQVLKLAQRQDASLVEVADALAADPALSVRLLKYANSALVGVAREVTTVREAVVLLGMRSVRMLALSFSLVSSDDRRACPGFDYGQFWIRSLAHAVAARHLARVRPGTQSEEAFAAALLASIGRLVFAVGVPAQYAEILARTGGAEADTVALERECFGVDFREAGAMLLEEWRIPGRLMLAVRHQCDPANPALPEDLKPLVAVVADARDFVEVVQSGQEPASNGSGGDALPPAVAAVPAGLIRAMHEDYREFESILSLGKPLDVDIDRIQAEAGEVLSELSVVAQLRSDAVERENQGLQARAYTDGLTGIANRAAFDKRLGEIWEATLRSGQPIALAMLDIDHFKKFNDTYGHRTGDAVLQAVAKCMPPCLRKVDVVARYGGEEFVVVMPNADRLVAAGICVSIRRAIEECVVSFEGRTHKVTVSVGSAFLPEPTGLYTRQMLVEAADQQLYRSKEKGRNCCSMKQLPRTPACEVLAGK
jgi:diguanylate cyclase (GGDEF)-like protein